VAPTTIGVDLSVQPSKTAMCVIQWGDSPRITHLSVGAENRTLVDLIAAHEPTKVAVDAPFGWPVPFIGALSEWTTSGTWPARSDRRPLLFRTTDLAVKHETGTDPLSVSSNLLAICAMRCAELLVQLGGSGGLDRTGAGLVVEVYPAAALRQWGFNPRGYKGSKPDKIEKRRELVEGVAAATSHWLELADEHRVLLAANDHLFDALISAIVGRAVEIGRTLPIPDEHRAIAATEGWIHLPERQPLSQFHPVRRGASSRE
jgi:predicted nuclease with RNAse H fold